MRAQEGAQRGLDREPAPAARPGTAPRGRAAGQTPPRAQDPACRGGASKRAVPPERGLAFPDGTCWSRTPVPATIRATAQLLPLRLYRHTHTHTTHIRTCAHAHSHTPHTYIHTCTRTHTRTCAHTPRTQSKSPSPRARETPGERAAGDPSAEPGLTPGLSFLGDSPPTQSGVLTQFHRLPQPTLGGCSIDLH